MSELSNNLRALRPLWTGLPVVALTTGLSLTAAWQYLRYAPPLYESTAKIKLADQNEGVLNTTLLKNLDAFSGDNRTSAEVELVRSPLLLNRALDRLPFDLSTYRVGKVRTTELYRASPIQASVQLRNPKWAEEKFDVQVGPGGTVRVAAPTGELAEGKLGDTLHLSGADVRVAPNDSLLRARPDLGVADHYQLVQHDRARLVEDIGSRLDVTSTDRFVPVLRISFQSKVPQKAADLVNTLSDVYLEDYLATKYKVVNSASDFISGQLKQVRQTLAHSEDTVQEYRDRKRIVNIKQETDTDLHKVAELKMQRATLQMSLAAANDLYRYMTDGKRSALELAPNFEAFNDMLSTDIIKKIKDLQAQRHDLLLRFTPEDEQVQAVDLKLADLNNYLLESIRNTRNNLTIKSRELDRTIAQAEGAFVGLPTREKNLSILQRDFQLNEKLYTFLREKATEADIAKASPTSYHRIIAAGLVPVEPTSPHRTFVLVLAGFLGLLAGVLLVYLWRLVRSTPGDADGVQKETRTPLAAIIPHLGGGLAGRLAFFTQLATRLALKGLLAPGTKLVVSAFTEHEGQQFFFDNLRAALGAQGLKLRAIALRDAQSPNPDAHPDEVLLVQNLPLDHDAYALTVMRGATVNLVVIDGPRTPTRRLAELELLAQEFALPGVQLCLNRAGYAPSPLRVLLSGLRRAPGHAASRPRLAVVSQALTLSPWVLRLGRLRVAPRYWVVAGQATASATNFLTNLFIAKLCGLAVFGEYSAWQLVLLLALALQSAVVTQPMQVVLGALPAGRRATYGQLVLGGQLAFSGLAALGTVAGATWLPQAAQVLPAFLVVLVAGGAQDTLRKLLLAEGKVQSALAVDAVSGGGQLLALLALALRAAPATLPAVVWAVGLTSVPAVVLGSWALGARPTLSPRALRRYGRRHWRQARWLLPTALLQWGSANVLLVFAGWVGSPVMLGVLRLAQTAMGVFNLGLQAVENYALPRLSQSFHHAPVVFARQRAALGRKMLLAAGPVLALLALGAGPLLARFGPQGGAEYASLLRWCCLLYGVILLVYPLRLTVRLLGDSRHYFGGYVLSIAASVASVRWLTGHYQASGVVLGWLLAQLVLGAYWLVAVRRAALP